MAWRKLVIRVLVLVMLATTAVGYFFYERYIDPAAVRQSVLAELTKQFPGAEVRLGSADLRLLGGVELLNLELSRRDEPGGGSFAAFPSVVLRHDKEELARGRLVIRRIEAKGPRLTIVRRADGTWNMQGIARGDCGATPAPVMEVQQGTLVFLDQASGSTRLTLEDVVVKAMPYAAGGIRIEASGKSDVLGQMTINGTVDQTSGALQLKAEFPNAELGPTLRAHLGAYLAGCQQDALEVLGKASISAEFAFRPGTARPWSHEIALTLRDGSLRHPRFPLALNQVSALAHWNGSRLILDQLTAASHGAAIDVHGEMNGLSADADFELHVAAHHLRIAPDVYDKLPPQMAKICADFHPEGTMSLVSDVHQKAGRLNAGYTVTLEGMSILFRDFPYPVYGVTGSLVFQDSGESPTVAVKLAGTAGKRPVKVEGRVFGEGLSPEVEHEPGIHLDITGNDIPVDEVGIAALKEAPQRVARQFKPTGLVDVSAELRRPAGTRAVPRPPMQNHILLRFHDATMCYEKFPYPVENVQGTLELFSAGRWTFSGFKGQHRLGQFTGTARSTPTVAGNHIEVNVTGMNALLDREMETALSGSQRMARAYQLFNPQGRVDFNSKVDIIANRQPEIDLTVTAQNCAMKPSCFPYSLTDVTGTFRYVKDRVLLSEFRARHGNAVIKLGKDGDGGDVTLRQNGGYRAVLTQLHAEPLTIEAEFLKALPELASQAFATLQPNRPVRIITDLTIEDPGPGGRVRYDWNGHIAFADTVLHCGFELDHVTGLVACAGKFDGSELKADGNIVISEMTLGKQVFREVRSELKLTRQALVFPGIQATLHGGQLYGPIRVEFGPDFPFKVNLTASRINLEQFARETLGRSGQTKGTAGATLVLSGRGSDLRSLRGNGSLRIADAKLYDLPLVLDLLSALSGHLPKGSAFQEANADFTIDGERLNVSRLELLGDALSLRGLGDMRVDGSDIKLEMYGLLWGRTLPLLPPLIDQIPSWLSKRLMLIRVEGDLEKVRTKVEPVPFLVEPMKELLKTVSGRQRMEEAPRRSP
jgi:AsmA-like protein